MLSRFLLVASLSACGTSQRTTPDPTATPLEVVSAVFDAVTEGDEASIRALVREDYIQHSALAEDGIEGFIGIVDLLRASEITTHRVLTQDNLVALHQTYALPDGQRLVAFDVFRVEGGQLAEHWDAPQPEVTETVSGRSMVDGPTQVDPLANTAESQALVEGFVRVVLSEGNFDRLGEFISEASYAQHNPAIDDGLVGLGAFAASLAEQGLGFGYTRSPLVVAEGDFVLVGSEGFSGPTDAPPFAIFYDLFRVEGGRIVEHWDVLPPSPDPAALPHGNGFF
ncbi:MAG: nuclear transport factor 2 family protein [Myxococcota bacterium]